MGNSMREQWTKLIRNKLKKELETYRSAPAYKTAFVEIRNRVLSKLANPSIFDEIEVIDKEKDLAYKKYEKLRDESNRKERELADLLKEFDRRADPDEYGYCGTLNAEETIRKEVEKFLINDPYYLKNGGMEFKKLAGVLNNLQVEFLIATTPKQIKEAAESILKTLGWTVDDIK